MEKDPNTLSDSDELAVDEPDASANEEERASSPLVKDSDSVEGAGCGYIEKEIEVGLSESGHYIVYDDSGSCFRVEEEDGKDLGDGKVGTVEGSETSGTTDSDEDSDGSSDEGSDSDDQASDDGSDTHKDTGNETDDNVTADEREKLKRRRGVTVKDLGDDEGNDGDDDDTDDETDDDDTDDEDDDDEEEEEEGGEEDNNEEDEEKEVECDPEYPEDTHTHFFDYFASALNAENPIIACAEKKIPFSFLVSQKYAKRENKWYYEVDKLHALANKGKCADLLVDGNIDYNAVSHVNIAGNGVRPPIVDGKYIDIKYESSETKSLLKRINDRIDQRERSCGSNNVADSKAGSESVKAGGDSVKAAGESVKAGGDSVKAAGESIKAGGDSVKAAGESGKAGGDSVKAAGESGKAGGLSWETGGDSVKARSFTVDPESTYRDFTVGYSSTIESGAVKAKSINDEYLDYRNKQRALRLFKNRYPFTRHLEKRDQNLDEMTQNLSQSSQYLQQVELEAKGQTINVNQNMADSQRDVNQNETDAPPSPRAPPSSRPRGHTWRRQSPDTTECYLLKATFVVVFLVLLTPNIMNIRHMLHPDDGGHQDIEGSRSSAELVLVKGSVKKNPNADPIPNLSGDKVWRHKRQIDLALGEDKDGNDCITPSVKYYPDDFIPEEARAGYALHLLICLYMLAGIAQIIDHYYVPAVENICEGLGIKSNVAGATFMAAGSSMPEMVVTLIGLFYSKSDIGIGSVVGSCIFNMLFIIAVTGLFSKYPIQVSWYPITRDSIFYLNSILVLFAVSYHDSGSKTGTIGMLEGLGLVMSYLLYIVFMMFDGRVEKWVMRKLKKDQGHPKEEEKKNMLTMISKRRNSHLVGHHAAVDVGMLKCSTKGLKAVGMSDEEACKFLKKQCHVNHWSKEVTMYSNVPSPSGLASSGLASKVASDTLIIPSATSALSAVLASKPVSGEHVNKTAELAPSPTGSHLEINPELGVDQSLAEKISLDETPLYTSPLRPPREVLPLMYWVITLPFNLLHCLTIPDSRKVNSWQHRAYILSYINSIVYMSLYCYVMIWMAALAGNGLGIPDAMLSLSLLAAGTSIPELLTSIFVARDGYGDMAVSNALGSNIFNNLIAIGLPFFIAGATGKSDGMIHNSGLIFSIAVLVLVLVYLVAILKWNHWVLDFKVSVVTFGVYGVVMVFCNLLVTNIFNFGQSPPVCPT